MVNGDRIATIIAVVTGKKTIGCNSSHFLSLFLKLSSTMASMSESPHKSMVMSVQLYPQVASLLVYQDVFADSIGQALLGLLQRLHQGTQPNGVACLRAYGVLFRELAIADLSYQDWLVQRTLQDDNPFSQQAQRKPLAQISTALQNAVRHDLNTLQGLYQWSAASAIQAIQELTRTDVALVEWSGDRQGTEFLHQTPSWTDSLAQLAGYYHRHGVGKFAQYQAFRWRDGELENVLEPDWVPLTDLVGYDPEKETLLQNTQCLLAGLPALNVLLYGSRGSGKSSLIKALLGEFHSQGLRLVEVDKAGFKYLPDIVEVLRQQPQKFIIFVDDLSFEEDDDIFKSLKVVLEGSVRAKAPNVVVYATSNRRHLVREFFDERPRPSDAQEIHNWDTVQEKLSFSDRFGLTLTFRPANQDTYLSIVRHLADQANLNFSPEDLEFRAKQWATRHNGRSGRTARQFVDFLIGEQALRSP